MANIICINCMNGIMNTSGICTTCGKTDEQIETSRRHLPLRTILRGKYLIGKVIGEGGFGITYLGYDLDLEIRVAIKEFCPRDFAGRDADDRLTILPFDKESAVFFEAEKDKFINEAKRLARFRGEQGIVSVLDYFQENGTAYIVMEYIEGVTLKAFQKMAGGTMEPEKILNLIKPVMEGLSKLHASNIIHRDISPDNIMVDTSKQKVYLIDFGTAREVSPNEEHSLSVYKKGGYTPIEQQSRHGKQGPWTDVYALCATIYRCITGTSIPEANNRIMGDEVVKPSDMGIIIHPQTEEALLRGLEVKPEERTQSMEELMAELYETDNYENEDISMWEEALEETIEKNLKKETDEQERKEENSSKKSTSKFVLIFIAILAFLICVPLGIELMSGSDNNSFETQEDIQMAGMETKSEEETASTENSKQEVIEEQRN